MACLFKTDYEFQLQIARLKYASMPRLTQPYMYSVHIIIMVPPFSAAVHIIIMVPPCSTAVHIIIMVPPCSAASPFLLLCTLL